MPNLPKTREKGAKTKDKLFHNNSARFFAKLENQGDKRK